MNKIELLSPAGDIERLKITLLYGADAVYVGGYKYGLRAKAINFSKEELNEAIKFTHKLNKKIYLTINMVFHNSDYKDVYDYIDETYNMGIDAYIVSSLYLCKYIKDKYSDVEVHLSTQDSTTNFESVLLYKDLGIDRVVLARELGKDEIKEIIDKTKLDIEVFIHGAMCTCVSGRCALSYYLTGRDANKGLCAQVCRFDFNDDFTIRTKDLNMSLYIGDLIDIGVKSLKVEGRMRSIYYLATVIGTYRKIIDEYYKYGKVINIEKYEYTLSRVANRPTTCQYFKGYVDYNDEYYMDTKEESNQDYLGLVLNSDGKYLSIQTKNYFEKGEYIEVFTPSGKSFYSKIDEIIDENGNAIDKSIHPQNELKIKFDKKVDKYSMIRRVIKRFDV